MEASEQEHQSGKQVIPHGLKSRQRVKHCYKRQTLTAQSNNPIKTD